MKVIHVTYDAEPYGIRTFLIHLIECQKSNSNGLDVAVLFHSNGPCLDDFKRLAVPVYSLNLKTAKDIKSIFLFYKSFKDYDIVNLHTYSPWAFIGAKMAGKKVVYTFHGALGFKKKGMDLLIREYHKTILNRFCDRITFASNTSLETYLKGMNCRIKGSKIRRFPYGLDLRKVAPSRPRQEVRLDLNFDRRFIVGTAARIVPAKRIERLVEAFSYLPRNGVFELIIMGSGDNDYRSQLDNQVTAHQLQDMVRFLGYRRDVLDIISALDLFVLPSENEAFGLSLLEAMGLGVPSAVFQDGGGAVEILGQSGFIVKTPRSLSDLMVDLKADANLGETVGKEVKRRALQFDIRYTAEHLFQIYSSLLESK